MGATTSIPLQQHTILAMGGLGEERSDSYKKGVQASSYYCKRNYYYRSYHILCHHVFTWKQHYSFIFFYFFLLWAFFEKYFHRKCFSNFNLTHFQPYFLFSLKIKTEIGETKQPLIGLYRRIKNLRLQIPLACTPVVGINFANHCRYIA